MFKYILIILSLFSFQLYAKTDAEKLDEIYEMYEGYTKDFPNIKNVKSKELKKWLDNKEVILVDVRKPFERAVSFIPTSIPKEEFLNNKDKYKNKKIVAYCTIGYRSGKFTQALSSEGFNITNLVGSILAWTHEVGQLQNSQGMTSKEVHVFGKQWNLIPSGFKAIY